MSTLPNRPAQFASAALLFAALWAGMTFRSEAADAPLIRSAHGGRWTAPDTWEGGKVPPAGARVQIRPGHVVVYDLQSDGAIRDLFIAGVLTFDPDRDTRLDVGLIRIQAGDDLREEGFDCTAHLAEPDPAAPRPALIVGAADRPIDAKHTATIRLVSFDGMDKQILSRRCLLRRPHGLSRRPDESHLGQARCHREKGRSGRDLRRSGGRLEAGRPRHHHIHADRRRGSRLAPRSRLHRGTVHSFHRRDDHHPGSAAGASNTLGTGDYRGEVADLSRNVVVESADPALSRGHTMYHRGSAGSISYAEFRHLGKEGVLGRYALHFHLCGDTMRGSSVVGASIWDSDNRWLTIHGTNYLVVRDCVGYQSVGHGFFLEDGTEVYNVLDRNLAVQAFRGRPLPHQALPFDENSGAGFWWANCRNTFTRNVSCENDRYGFRFEATQTSALKLTLPVMRPDGRRVPVDIRTLPFVRFEDNESHCEGLYGFNLGEGVERVGPDARHPFIVRRMKLWGTHYAFRPEVPSLLVEDMRIWRAEYGVYHPNYDHHVYRDLYIGKTNTEPFNRGLDDDSVQYGPLTVDGLTFEGIRSGDEMPLIQISDDNPTGQAVSHFRNVKVLDWTGTKHRALVNLGGGPRPTPKTVKGVPVFLHDYFGPGRDAKVVSTKTHELHDDGLDYHDVPQLTGDESRAAEVHGVEFPRLLDPVDDQPPATVITNVARAADGKIRVSGVASDDGTIRRVVVNGRPATATAANFAQWEIVLDNEGTGEYKITAHAEDAAGNVETNAHEVTYPARP